MASADERLPSRSRLPELTSSTRPAPRLWPALFRQGPWIILSIVLVGGLSATLSYRQRPVYSSSVSLRIEDQAREAAGGMLPQLGSSPAIETEIEMLRSRSVSQDVVRLLALNATIAEPQAVSRSEALRVLLVADTATHGTYRIRRLADGIELVPPSGTAVRGEYGVALSASGLTLDVMRPAAGATSDFILTVGDTMAAAATVRANVKVSRPQANANLVLVTYEGSEPRLTSDIVNAVALAYLERRNAMQKRRAAATVRFLDSQERSIGTQLGEAEAALELFRRQNVIVDPAAQSSDQVRRLADVRARRAELDARREALRALLATTIRPGDSTGWSAVAANPAIAGNAAISDLLQQLTRLETERIQLSERRTAADPDMRSLLRTADVLTRRMNALVQVQLRALDIESNGQGTIQASLDSALLRVPGRDLEYGRLRRQVDVLSQLHTLLQTRLKEAQISEAVETADIQVVDPAVPSFDPVRPRPRATLVFGLASGLLLGLLVAFGRELSDTVMRSRDDVRALTDIPVLASIPHQAVSGRLRGNTDRRVRERLVTRYAPRSAAAEAFRALRTSISFSGTAAEQACGILVVTSAEPQAGKSTTAANLAVTLAEQGKRVLLLEADQRRPILHRVLGVPRAPGLTDVLAARATLAETMHRIAISELATGSLDFVAGGTVVPNPAELLGSKNMRELLGNLATVYDTILLDTPPMGLVTDAAVAGTGADGVILVARMGATHSESLRRAVEDLRAIGAPVVGLVLTDVRRRDDHYGSYYGQYYSE